MGVVISLPVRRVRACDFFDGDGKFCRACTWSRLLHRNRVSCSQCGRLFLARPGVNARGFSACVEHGRKP